MCYNPSKPNVKIVRKKALPMARLAGENVMLREFRWEDLPEMRRWICDGRATRYLGTRFIRPQTWEQTEQMLRGLLMGEAGGESLVIADIGTLGYLGQISLQGVDRFSQQAELAVIVSPEHWGKGVATEAIGLMLRYAFHALNLNRVWLKVFAEHEAAVRLYRKCGFVQEGVLRQDAFLEGRYRDTIVMSVLRDEFNKAQA